MALLIDTERPVTATVKEAGQLLKISRGVFRRVLEEYPEAADALRDLIARRMEDTLLDLGRVGDSLMAIKD